MRKYGKTYTNKTTLGVSNYLKDTEQEQIKAVLTKLGEGYKKRDPKLAETYMKELFINDDSLFMLGTSSDELCPGLDEVKDLLESDWEYWGDVEFQLDKVLIDVSEDVAWFATPGTVKYTFEHSQSRYDSYVDFVRTKANDETMSASKRIALVNWALALTYHQQTLDVRDYYCAMRMTGVMVKKAGQWKIAQSQFSMAKGVFPDERFESSQEFIDEYTSERDALLEYKKETLDPGVETFITNFASDCIGKNDVKMDQVNQYFSSENKPYIISPDTEWYVGKEKILEFLHECEASEMILDTESAITRTSGNKTWVTGIGQVKQTLTTEEIATLAVEALNDICDSEKTSQEKLYSAHKQVAYALKECSIGESYTCPVRYSVMITQNANGYIFEHMHLSYPFYWIFEGKLDTVES